jgi:hypothetical protein
MYDTLGMPNGSIGDVLEEVRAVSRLLRMLSKEVSTLFETVFDTRGPVEEALCQRITALLEECKEHARQPL